MQKKNTKIAFILNVVLALLEIFAVGWMMSGIKIAGSSSALTAARLATLKFFTVDSNIIAGVFAIIVAVDLWMVMKGKKTRESDLSYILTLVGAVGVTLTMLVTVFFLAPTFENGWVTCFSNSNFFLHLINPLVSIVLFAVFMRGRRIKFVHTFTGIIPLLIYAAYYVANVFTHLDGGKINPAYDWYGFFMMGTKSVFVVLPIIIVITYGISVALWKIHKGSYKKS